MYSYNIRRLPVNRSCKLFMSSAKVYRNSISKVHTKECFYSIHCGDMADLRMIDINSRLHSHFFKSIHIPAIYSPVACNF